MSNRCSNLCNHTSFSLCTPLKPYTTTRRSFFPSQHNLISIGRRSRRKSSYLLLKVASQSSSDIVLIETKEHHDGSLVFRFGDASEVVENDDVVEEIESQTEQESSAETVLDGDQDRQVIMKRGDGGYDSVEGRLLEVADGIMNAVIGSDLTESEANGIRDLSDYHAESNDILPDISEKEVPISQSDDNLNDFVNVNEAKFSVELDEDECSDPTISFLDSSPNVEKSADPEGTLLKGGDKPVDPSVSVELESTQVSQTEVMDDLDKVETEDRKSDTEDITPSTFSATTPISDIELTDAANEDVEEELKDVTVNEGTLIDGLPPSTPLDVRLTNAVNEDAEEELQDIKINEATIIDEMSSSDQLVVEKLTLDEVSQLQSLDLKDQSMEDEDAEEELPDMNINEATIIDRISSSDQLVAEQSTLDEVSQLQSVDVKDQTMEDELQQVSTKNSKENDVAYVMPVSRIEEADLVVEEEVSQPQSTPLELKPSIQALDIDLQDTLGQDLDNGILQVDNEIKDSSVSVNLEEIQVSDNEVMDVTQPYAEEESQMGESKDTSEGDTQDLPPPATMPVSDVDMDEKFQDIITSEGTFIDEMPTPDPLESEPTLEVSTNKGIDVDMDERLQNMKISEGTFIDEIPASDPLGAEPTSEVSSTRGVDVKDLAVEDELQLVSNEVDIGERLQAMDISEGTLIDEITASDPLGAEPTLDVSCSEGMKVKDLAVEDELQLVSNDVDMDEWLQDTAISEGTLLDEIPASDPLGAEPTFEVSSTEGMDVKDLAVEDELQLVSSIKMDENEIADGMPAESILEEEVRQPHLASAELKATMQVSDIKVQDDTVDEVEGDSYIEDAGQSSHQLESQPVRDEGVKPNMLEQYAKRLQDMNIREGTSVDDLPTSDPLGAEPMLEVSTTEGMNVKDLAVEDELKLVSNDKMDENEIADVMPAEPTLEEEVSQPHLLPVEHKATMQVSDIKVQDDTGRNQDDEIFQVISEDANDSYMEDVEQSPNQLASHLVQDEGVKDNMLEQWDESDAAESSILPEHSAHDPMLEAERTEGMVSSSELAEASEVTAIPLAAEAEVEREEIYLTDCVLLSGAALLEHPVKALTGGDDAYFVAGSKWLGVANGVGQWSFEGTGPGVYALELMRSCEEIASDTSCTPITNPVELLCKSVKETNMSGSSNVLIANFNGQALHVANIGDTGFLIIRHGVGYKKSSPLLHEFHFAVQVDNSDNPLQLVEEYLIELEVGDIVVAATDGLFDNLYEREITMIVSKSLQAGIKPQEIANILATRAQEVGKSSFVRSPFSDAAQAAGYTGYAGGKPDNVAVVVSLVEKSSNPLAV